jgi:N-acetylglutamate synthase-like GNAT family acetyltransferase
LGFLVRIASVEDDDGVTALLGTSYPTLMRGSYEDTVLNAALPFMTVAQPALLQSDSYYVAEISKGTIVGCGGWTKERPASGEITEGVAHIRHFGVHPEWARRGIGRAIYARCCEDATAAGIGRFECYSSINAESFYAALGFERLEEIILEMPGGISFPSIHMLATL